MAVVNNEYENVSTTLFIGNIPYTTNQKQLEDAFGDIGPIRRCFIVKDKGVGYVTFALREDAELAMKTVKKVGGRNINTKFAKKRSETTTKAAKIVPDNEDGVEIGEKTKQKTKTKRKKANPKKVKLIIRNLSFKANEETVKKEFEKFGTVIKITIPTKSDGKMRGFCFVQYESVSNANNAKQKMNGKEFLSRPIAVDWAVPKKTYLEVKSEEKQLLDPDSEPEEVENDDELSDESIKDDAKEIVKTKKVVKNKMFSKDEDVEDYIHSDDEEEEGDLSENDDSEDGGESDDTEADDEVEKVAKEPQKSADVNEGKTLFIRNLNFDTTKEDLAETFSKFGQIHYAVICINKDTEYSKGSGFVKFRNEEDAKKCLEAATEQTEERVDGVESGGIVLGGQTLLVSLAVSKEELQKQAAEKQKKQKDNRNLYLAREGLIRPGTKAAEDVSKQDLSKRIQLEVWKQRMLTNYHIFVAKTRLCVRNLPPNITDSRFKNIFLDAGGPEAEITEARVMRDIRKLTEKGNPSSKGYGFVTFTTHEHALKALRNTNNNPAIFTNNSRPIVEFSLENRAALNARVKRLEKSQQQNKTPQKSTNDTTKNRSQHHEAGASGLGGENPSFSGSKANKSMKKLPSHVGPKIRHKKRNKTGPGSSKITRRKLRRDDQKLRSNQRNQKWEKTLGENKGVRPPKKKKTRMDDRSDAKFDTMVARHKRKQAFGADTSGKRKKWFHND